MVKCCYRLVSCTIYVVGIVLCNSCFLLTFFLIWLSKYATWLYNLPGYCQMVTLLSCTSNFLSCWYAIFLALDRYMLLYQPQLKAHLCTTTMAKIVTGVTAALAIAIHVNVSLTVDVYNIPTRGNLCLPIPIHMEALNALGKVDVFVNVIFAYTMLFVLTFVCWAGLVRNMRGTWRRNFHCKVDNMVTKACNVLLTVFLFLCAPSQLVRVYCTVRELAGHTSLTPFLYSIQQLLQYPYYSAFAVSGVVYLLNMDMARKALKKACLKLYRRIQVCKKPPTVDSLASSTIITLTEITNLKNVTIL